MNLYDKIIKKYKPLEPIFFEELLETGEAKSTLGTRLNKLVGDGLIKKYSRGIYYISKYDKVLNMELNITFNDVIEAKYIKKNNKVFGFYAEDDLLNMYNFSSQVPMISTIITNNETTRKRKITIGNLEVYVKKSHAEITNDNSNVLQLLEFINFLDSSDYNKDKEEKFLRIKNLMRDKKIDLKDAKAYICFFPTIVAKRLMEIENEIA